MSNPENKTKTDYQIIAAIGKRYFKARAVERYVGFWVVALPGGTSVIQAKEPDDEQIGCCLAYEGYDYITDSKWIGPIIFAAAQDGIMVSLMSEYDDRNDVMLWRIKTHKIEEPSGCEVVCRAEYVPRTLCLEILGAHGVRIKN